MPLNCYEMKLLLSVTFTADREYENASVLPSSEYINSFPPSSLTFCFELMDKNWYLKFLFHGGSGLGFS